MLKPSSFSTCFDSLFYEGDEAHYFIRVDEYNSAVLTVEQLDDTAPSGVTISRFAFSDISAAVAAIEALERGEEI